MTPKLRTYLENTDTLIKLDPSRMPLDILLEYSKLSTEDLFKVCAQCVILRHNIPEKTRLLTLEEDEIKKLTISYAKEIISALKAHKINNQ